MALETATRGLDQLAVTHGMTLFVNGASGGIGSAATQLARARVIGSAGAANQSYLATIGAEPVIYGDGISERVRALAPDGVDVALDVAGNGVLPELIALAGGAPQRVVTLADFQGAEDHGVHFSNGFKDGNAFHALHSIGELIASGRFWLPVEKTYPLADIREAHHAGEHGRIRGRLVLVVGGAL
ncbi:zinc-binding dehydrogenase [Streptomyces panaciradicis]|nr:zinc-binding dehydrogenase [Streptomyces panaciradicis]MCL6667474.1 zinc-binding dehydrogenase [Streptomyces panaciradicis]